MSRRIGQIVSRGRQRWLVRVFLGRERETRKRRYHNRTIRGTARRAQEYLTKMLRERELGRGLEGSEITLNEFLDRWLEAAAKPKLRAKSYRSYEGLLRHYIRPVLGGRILSTITPLDIQTSCQQLIDRGLSSRTVRYTHSVLRSAMRQAIRWRLLLQDPTEGVQLPRLGRREMRVLTVEQSRIFLEAALKTHYGPVFAVALTTGMRPSEYLALRWSVDWDRGTVSVVRTLERTAGCWRFAETKRSRSRRVIKLQGWVLEILRRLEATTSKRPKCDLPDAADLVFTTATGRPIHSDKLAQRFKHILREAGLPTIRLYDLRHTAATLALSAGVPPKVVAEQLGHASAAFTLDVYSHLLPHMQEEAATKVEQILAGPSLLRHRTGGKKRFRETGPKKPPKSANTAPEGSRTSIRT
ncbi:MAG: site-specific integrase [Acidobacteriia bacterium]|nr:site-specific integrase [Terriglobia bacterium]